MSKDLGFFHVSDIKNESQIYKFYVINMMSRYFVVLSNMASSDHANVVGWFTLEAMLRTLAANLTPFYYAQDRAELKNILNKLKKFRGTTKRGEEYFDILEELTTFISERLHRLGIIPPTDVEALDMATDEELAEEKLEAGRNYLKRLIQDRKDMKPEEIIAEIMKPTVLKIKPKKISEIIDNTYLLPEDYEETEIDEGEEIPLEE